MSQTLSNQWTSLRALIAELEAQCAPAAIQRHYMRGYNAANANRRSYVAKLEAERDRLKIATQSSLMVLCAARDGQENWSANFLKDFDFAIDACRAALSGEEVET